MTHNARAAAFGDPRFPTLVPEELPSLSIEVSVLTAPKPLPFSSEEEALSRLRPGIDGVIFQYGGRRATFLPQVWSQHPDPREFMALLKQKAGFSASLWSDVVQLAVYQVEKFEADAETAGHAARRDAGAAAT